MLLYSRKLLREKTFVNFVVLWVYVYLGLGVLWCSKSEQSAKVFSMKFIFFTNSRKFSPSKVSRYTVSREASKPYKTCSKKSNEQVLVCHVKDFPICLSVLVSTELSYRSTHVEVNVHDVNMYIILYTEVFERAKQRHKSDAFVEILYAHCNCIT